MRQFLLGGQAAGEDDGAGQETELVELAAAALMTEIGLSDRRLEECERAEIGRRLRAHFHFSEANIEALLQAAEERLGNSVSLYDFTRRLNEGLGRAERGRIVDSLWRVAAADGRIDPHEEHAIRKIAGLLKVSHTRFVQGRAAVAGENGNG
ncbi:MAG: TerB family tellurite resistance protein [Gammaproteobacteria bacterium]|nr:TerB family tellurite resistance protein [Gammaproteobacteria bacterium]MDD9863955.1 TerB family tellurite resistance protein [Gammaproteobacteria bacterium]